MAVKKKTTKKTELAKRISRLRADNVKSSKRSQSSPVKKRTSTTRRKTGIAESMTPAQRRRYMENAKKEAAALDFYDRSSSSRKAAIDKAGNNPYKKMRKSLKEDPKFQRKYK